ncbi:hypothetical protein M6B38_390345 [Iris pallida]|uniref:Uncharacterized protein n=1 Tax=Iris pallida TaxID=29817 RepID=A0AAX6G0K4_IRIPA|nr:hypothetical protein M6B38_390345 [Iris pallida]
MSPFRVCMVAFRPLRPIQCPYKGYLNKDKHTCYWFFDPESSWICTGILGRHRKSLKYYMITSKHKVRVCEAWNGFSYKSLY